MDKLAVLIGLGIVLVGLCYFCGIDPFELIEICIDICEVISNL